MKIISAQEANSNPVGEGQEEPNKDPRLTQPATGRNLGALIAGSGLGAFFAWFNFGLIKKLLMAVSIGGSV